MREKSLLDYDIPSKYGESLSIGENLAVLAGLVRVGFEKIKAMNETNYLKEEGLNESSKLVDEIQEGIVKKVLLVGEKSKKIGYLTQVNIKSNTATIRESLEDTLCFHTPMHSDAEIVFGSQKVNLDTYSHYKLI